MNRHPFIPACGQLFLLVAATILSTAIRATVSAESFPHGLMSHPPSKQEKPEMAPRAPLSKPGKGKFLVADRSLSDPNFSQTVVLLIDHSPEGAIGAVINRPSTLKLSSLFPDEKSMKDRSDNLYIGGPVAIDRLTLLVKIRKEPQGAFHIFEDIYVGGTPQLIFQMLERGDPEERFRAYIGYSGWGSGQLEREVERGDWHILQADSATIFDKENSKIWPELILLFSSKWVRSELRSLRSEVRSLQSEGAEPQRLKTAAGRKLPTVR